MVLTGDGRRVPFTAAHRYWYIMARRLDPPAAPGQMCKDWKGLADQLGFGYDEIRHIPCLRDDSGSNTIKLFNQYVQNNSGGCLHTVMKALGELGRADVLKVLNDNMPDIEMRAQRQPRENTDLYGQIYSRCPTGGPPPDHLYIGNQQNGRCQQNGRGSNLGHLCPQQTAQCPNPRSLPDHLGRQQNCRCLNPGSPGHLYHQQTGGCPQSGSPQNIQGRARRDLWPPHNDQRAFYQTSSRDSSNCTPGRQMSFSDETHVKGITPVWEPRGGEIDLEHESMEVQVDSLPGHCESGIDNGVVYSHQDYPAPVAEIIMRQERLLLPNTFSPESICVGAEEEVTTSEESMDSLELPRSKGKEKEARKGRDRTERHRREAAQDNLKHAPQFIPQKAGRPTVIVNRKYQHRVKLPNQNHWGEGDMEVDHSLPLHVQSHSDDKGLDDEQNRNHSCPLPASHTRSDVDGSRRHSWPPIGRLSSVHTDRCDHVKQSRSAEKDFKPKPYGKVPIRVFITYAQDSEAHKNEVLCLYRCLKKNGFIVHLDIRDKEFAKDRVGWINKNISEADFIVICVSPRYKQIVSSDIGRKGDISEENCRFINQLIVTEYIRNKSRNERFRIVIFPNATKDDRPLWMHNTLSHIWREDWKAILFSMIRPEKVVKRHADNCRYKPLTIYKQKL